MTDGKGSRQAAAPRVAVVVAGRSPRRWRLSVASAGVVLPPTRVAERDAPLRYRRGEAVEAAEAGAGFDRELAFVKIRYKLPEADASTLFTRPVTPADGYGSVAAAPPDARFAAAVAGFGQLLRGGRYTGGYGYDDVIALAQGARGEDPFGYRAEFVALVRLARSLASAE